LSDKKIIIMMRIKTFVYFGKVNCLEKLLIDSHCIFEAKTHKKLSSGFCMMSCFLVISNLKGLRKKIPFFSSWLSRYTCF
jgi:hypothetical protein